jgi:hypothetical protein
MHNDIYNIDITALHEETLLDSTLAIIQMAGGKVLKLKL